MANWKKSIGHFFSLNIKIKHNFGRKNKTMQIKKISLN